MTYVHSIFTLIAQFLIVKVIFNPKKSGLYQFHSYGQPKGESSSSYLGSWTIVID